MLITYLSNLFIKEQLPLYTERDSSLYSSPATSNSDIKENHNELWPNNYST